MNYLAHAWVWPDDAETLAGGLYGDFIHGRLPAEMPSRLAAAVMLHRHIDRATDTFPAVVSLREAMPPMFRRYAGIVLDMGFDHVLARDFDRWYHEPLPQFATRVYDAVRQYRQWVPPQRQTRIDYLLNQRLLERYRDLDAVIAALTGIGTRLSRTNPLHLSGPLLRKELPALERVLPELLAHLKTLVPRA